MIEIREAEERAKALVEEARQTASAQCARAEAEGKAFLEQSEKESWERSRERLEACHKEADAILAEGEAASKKIMQDMRAATDNHLNNAVKILLWGISDQCQ